MGRRSPGPVGFEQAIAATIRPVAITLMIPDRRNRMTYRSNDAWIETAKPGRRQGDRRPGTVRRL